MLSVYNLGILFYHLALLLASPFNKKASKFLEGRKNLLKNLPKTERECIWIHCASLGEFEQGRPLIETIKNREPETRIVLTFFSPSGYEVRKDFPLADLICYLPLDTKSNAESFIETIQPKAVFFIKYEWWYHYSHELKKRHIPLYSVSSIFRENQPFFKKNNQLHLKILSHFSHFFVQNEHSLQLLGSINFNNATVVGDTRFDRVAEICSSPKHLPKVNAFVKENFCIVIGSSWPQDINIIAPVLNTFQDIKIIVAPHELHEGILKHIEKSFENSTVRYSQLEDYTDVKTLIIDNMGMLSSIYQYADIAYVGGAFGKGLHNTLEAATYGLPIIFGPKFDKFQEAVDMVNAGCAFSIKEQSEFKTVFNNLYSKTSYRTSCEIISKKFVQTNLGATAKILDIAVWKD